MISTKNIHTSMNNTSIMPTIFYTFLMFVFQFQSELDNGVFLNGAELSLNSVNTGNLINH